MPAIIAVETVLADMKKKPDTLIYAAKDENHNHAIVLVEFIQKINFHL